MRINHYLTCLLVCVLIAIGASSMAAKEQQKEAFNLLQQRYIDGIDCLSKTRVALLEAELAIESESNQRLKKLEEYVHQLKQQEQYHVIRFEGGLCPMDEMNLSVASRIHGEIILLEEQERHQRR